MAKSLLCLAALVPFGIAGKSKLDASMFCGTCQGMVDELNSLVLSDKSHKVQTGYRMDKKEHRPYARTETRLVELIEDDLKAKVENLAPSQISLPGGGQVVYRREGELSSLGDHAYKGGSSKLRKQAGRIYQRIVDDHTEELVKWFYDSTPVRDVKQQLCVELIGACTEIVDWSDEEAAEKRGEAVKLHRASEEKHKRREAKKAAKKAKLEAEDKARKEADEKAANQESNENQEESQESSSEKPGADPNKNAAKQEL